MKISIDDLLKSKPPKNGTYYTVAIDGRGGAGKSTLVEYLRKELPHYVFLNGDDYFEPVKNEIVWGKFNEARFKTDVIDTIRKGKQVIQHRPYDWENARPLDENDIEISNGVLIERVFSFAFNIDWDLKIWVETPKTTARERGMARETMPLDRVQAAWKHVWQPAEDIYINQDDPMHKADVIVYGTKPFSEQIS